MPIPSWLTLVSWIFISVGLASAVLVAGDIFLLGYREHMRIMEAVWHPAKPVRGLKDRRSRAASLKSARNPSASGLSLANIAAMVGYGSPYAFAAAFRRHHGIAPGAWRQQQSTAPLTLNGAEDPAAPAEPDDRG
jgi:hypothetical protein